MTTIKSPPSQSGFCIRDKNYVQSVERFFDVLSILMRDSGNIVVPLVNSSFIVTSQIREVSFGHYCLKYALYCTTKPSPLYHHPVLSSAHHLSRLLMSVCCDDWRRIYTSLNAQHSTLLWFILPFDLFYILRLVILWLKNMKNKYYVFLWLLDSCDTS